MSMQTASVDVIEIGFKSPPKSSFMGPNAYYTDEFSRVMEHGEDLWDIFCDYLDIMNAWDLSCAVIFWKLFLSANKIARRTEFTHKKYSLGRKLYPEKIVELAQKLKNGKLTGVGLDVLQQEPYLGPLVELENVVITPHIGSYAKDVRIQMEIESTQNLVKGILLEEK